MPDTSVCIIYKHSYNPAREEAARLEQWLKERGVTVFSLEMRPKEQIENHDEVPAFVTKALNCVVVLGGDGTLLGAARKVGRYGVPILGVNLGGLGFLTCIPVKSLYPSMDMVLKDKLETESRLLLETKVLRDDKEACCFQTLNDVVINKGALARIIDLDVFINKEFLTTFRADGLIISTPTGSTGYNLAAGGPILYPTMSNVILTPICPFTLTNRPIILPDSETVTIKIDKAGEDEVSLTFDGQVGFDLQHGDEIMLYKSNDRIKLYKSPDQSYFEILRTKLMWGGATYNQNGDK
ncbi:NAD(+)/NADH kinase [Thermodesulfobacteriota bacterium]